MRKAKGQGVVATDKAPKAIGPYSQAISAGKLIFTAGQVALDPVSGQLVGTTAAEQTDQVLKNLQAVLEAAGVSFEHVVKTTVFLADMAQDIQLLKLEDDRITANGANVLAFDDGIDWDIKRVEGASGALAGGLYDMELSGSGWVALVSDGPPVLIELDGEETYADPQAAITWSSGLTSSVKADVNMMTLIGRGSGETVQLSFSGKGWLLIQPSEGRVSSTAAGGSGSSGGAAGGLGKLLGG